MCASLLHNLSATVLNCWQRCCATETLLYFSDLARDPRCRQKIGVYLRGTALLHNLILDRKWRDSLKAIQFIAVPTSEPPNSEFCHEWYRVIETIYTRRRGFMNATSGQLYTALQKAVDSYLSCSHTFRKHAEIQLIECLIAYRKRLEVRDISKLLFNVQYMDQCYQPGPLFLQVEDSRVSRKILSMGLGDG